MLIPYLESLNPFYKGITTMICALLLSINQSISLNVVVFSVCLLSLFLFSKASNLKILKFMFPIIFTAIGLFLTGYFFSNSATSGTINIAVIHSTHYGLQLASRVLAFAGLGLIFSLTTEATDLVASLHHQGKLPPKFAYGILAAFHLLPNINQAYQNSKLALEVRGITTHPLSFQPIFNMFVNVIQWSERLAMAMESKGFDEDATRSYYQETTVNARDYFFLFFSLFVIILGMYLTH